MAVNLALKILVVDDYSTIRRITRNTLTQLGFSDIAEATDGSSALATLREQRIGLVLSDWVMEPMTGLALLRAMRADAKLAGIPFVMLTSGSHQEDPAVAKEAGAGALLVKPFTTVSLKQALTSVLGPF